MSAAFRNRGYKRKDVKVNVAFSRKSDRDCRTVEISDLIQSPVSGDLNNEVIGCCAV